MLAALTVTLVRTRPTWKAPPLPVLVLADTSVSPSAVMRTVPPASTLVAEM